MILRSANSAAFHAEFFAGIDSIPGLLAKRTALTPSAPAYLTEQTDGTWSATTWLQFQEDVAALSSQFARHGITLGSRLGILAPTSLGWEAAQMAALACGATVAGIDPYYTDALINRLLAQLGITCLVVEDAATFARLSATNRERFGFVAYIKDNITGDPGSYPSLTRLRALGSGSVRSNTQTHGGTPALVAFSSGSTGSPKPILYTHAQVVHACRCILEVYPELSAGTHLVCWLPLANLFQRMINFCATAIGATSYIVEDPRHVMDVVPIANPEVFVCVPRFCEKLHAGITQKIGRHPLIARLVEWAITLGAALHTSRPGRSRMSPIKRFIANLADHLILGRLRRTMGTRIRFIVSGSAPMPRWLLDRFCAMGIPILEAYGVSENLVPVAANRLAEHRAGTVGKPVGDNEVRIGSDGEVQVRGFGVFTPVTAEDGTIAEALTDDGFHDTGDLGSFDQDGFLTLHGRRAEVFKNAQGRWVRLAEIEAVLRQLPEVEHAAVIRMPHDRLIAVLALGQSIQSAASGRALDGTEFEHRLGVTLRKHLALALSTLPGAMQPVAFLAVSDGFTPAGGEITSNFKLRRDAITEKFSEPLSRLAADSERLGQAKGGKPLLMFL